MTQEEAIVEGNKVLEQFVSGRKPHSNGVQVGMKIRLGRRLMGWVGLVHVDDLNYHSSYDTLMMAWIKFRDLNIDTKHQLPSHSDYKCVIHSHLGYAPILETFKQLVAAIRWYNHIVEQEMNEKRKCK